MSAIGTVGVIPIPTIHSGTAQAGAAKSLTLAATASEVADFYKYMQVHILSGTGAGQERNVVASRKNLLTHSNDLSLFNFKGDPSGISASGNTLTYLGINNPFWGQLRETGAPVANRTFVFSVELWVDAPPAPSTGHRMYVYDNTVTDIHFNDLTLTTVRTRYFLTAVMAPGSIQPQIVGRIDFTGFHTIGDTFHAENWQLVEGADVDYIHTKDSQAVGITVDSPWATQPDATSVYEIYIAGKTPIGALSAPARPSGILAQPAFITSQIGA